MRLKEQYIKKIRPELKQDLKLKNDFLAPRLMKVVINVGFGRQHKEKELITAIVDGLTKISGQKPVLIAAKTSVSAFKIREGMIIGAKVTLRGQRMYDFTEKLVNITFPLVRDFRGLSEKAVDQQGNLTVGFKEQTSFPETRLMTNDQSFGLEVCLTTSAKSRQAGLTLFRLLGFPFKKEVK